MNAACPMVAPHSLRSARRTRLVELAAVDEWHQVLSHADDVGSHPHLAVPAADVGGAVGVQHQAGLAVDEAVHRAALAVVAGMAGVGQPEATVEYRCDALHFAWSQRGWAHARTRRDRWCRDAIRRAPASDPSAARRRRTRCADRRGAAPPPARRAYRWTLTTVCQLPSPGNAVDSLERCQRHRRQRPSTRRACGTDARRGGDAAGRLPAHGGLIAQVQLLLKPGDLGVEAVPAAPFGELRRHAVGPGDPQRVDDAGADSHPDDRHQREEDAPPAPRGLRCDRASGRRRGRRAPAR